MLSGCRAAKVGSTLHIYDPSMREQIEREAFAKDEAVVELDGSKVYQQDHTVIDTTKTGSDMYTWDRTGNKAKHTRYRVHVDKDGKVTRTKVKTIWKSPV